MATHDADTDRLRKEWLENELTLLRLYSGGKPDMPAQRKLEARQLWIQDVLETLEGGEARGEA